MMMVSTFYFTHAFYISTFNKYSIFFFKKRFCVYFLVLFLFILFQSLLLDPTAHLASSAIFAGSWLLPVYCKIISFYQIIMEYIVFSDIQLL